MSGLDTTIRDDALAFVAEGADSMRAETIALAEINSGSYHAAGVNRVREALAALFDDLGAESSVLPSPPLEVLDDDGALRERALGDGLRLRKRPDAPFQVFLCGHMDTVFPADHPFQAVREIDGDYLYKFPKNFVGTVEVKALPNAASNSSLDILAGEWLSGPSGAPPAPPQGPAARCGVVSSRRPPCPWRPP